MEVKFAYSTKELFAKLRIFDVISDVTEFTSHPNGKDKVILAINNKQSEFWVELMMETLLNLHYKLISKPGHEKYGQYRWQNVYTPFRRLEVNLLGSSIAFRFQKEDSAYEFFNWIDDICHNICKIRGDPPEKFRENENIFLLLQEQEEEQRLIPHLRVVQLHPEEGKGKEITKPIKMQPLVYSAEPSFNINSSHQVLNCRTDSLTIAENLSQLCFLINKKHL